MAYLGVARCASGIPRQRPAGRSNACAPRALMNRPALVVLDETTSGLDAATMGVVGLQRGFSGLDSRRMTDCRRRSTLCR